MPQKPSKATGIAFKYLERPGAYGINYDSMMKILNGSKGSTLEIILKDEHTHKGTEDIYEITF